MEINLTIKKYLNMYENSRNTILYGLITISLYICKNYLVHIIYMCNGHDLNTFSNINKFNPMCNNYMFDYFY